MRELAALLPYLARYRGLVAPGLAAAVVSNFLTLGGLERRLLRAPPPPRSLLPRRQRHRRDLTLVLAGGELVERGTHAALQRRQLLSEEVEGDEALAGTGNGV